MFNRVKSLKIRLFKPIVKREKKQPKQFRFVIHPVTILLLLGSIFVGMFWLFFTYLVCLLLHEFSHYLFAKKLGYRCTKITLYPSGALLSGDTDEFTFKDEIIISLAGPLCNILLVIICVFLWWIFPEVFNYTADFVVANLSLALFNLLPIFPLDGGRCLLAILSTKLERKSASKISKQITMGFAIMLFFVFAISCITKPNFQIGIMSIVIFCSVLSESSGGSYKRFAKTSLKRRKLKHGLAVKTLLFNKDVTISKVISKIDNFAYYKVVVVDDNYNVLKIFTEKELEDLIINISPTKSLQSVLETNSNFSNCAN